MRKRWIFLAAAAVPVVLLSAVLTLSAREIEAQRGDYNKDLRFTDVDDGAPMSVRVTGTYGRINFSAPAMRLSVLNPEARKRPVVLVLAGCGFGDLGADYPRSAIRLSVWEDSRQLARPTLMEACLAKDPNAIREAVTEQARFLLSQAGNFQLGDQSKIVLFASGEAVPVAAELTGPLVGKVLLGEPCLVSWRASEVDLRTPTFVIQGKDPVGLNWTGRTPDFATVANASTQVITAMMSRKCTSLPMPALSGNFRVVPRAGQIGLTTRSADVLASEAQAFEQIVGEDITYDISRDAQSAL